MELKYTIGYIDEDEKQVKLYRRELREHNFDVIGYEFKKGMTLAELMEQVYSSDIDLLMIDYRLKESNIVGFNGEEVERDIYEKKPQFPHIIFTNKVDQAEPFVEDWKIIFSKDEMFEDEEKKRRFVKILAKSIEQYKNMIVRKKNKIEELIRKGGNEGLNSSEKSMLLEIQEELVGLDKTMVREIPKQLVSIENLENLSKTRKEAEAFLESLIDEN